MCGMSVRKETILADGNRTHKFGGKKIVRHQNVQLKNLLAYVRVRLSDSKTYTQTYTTMPLFLKFKNIFKTCVTKVMALVVE